MKLNISIQLKNLLRNLGGRFDWEKKSAGGRITAEYEFFLWTVLILSYSPGFNKFMWPSTVNYVELHQKPFSFLSMKYLFLSYIELT